jgi:hypothetical protein
MEHHCQFVAMVSDDYDIVRGTVRMTACHVPGATLLAVGWWWWWVDIMMLS